MPRIQLEYISKGRGHQLQQASANHFSAPLCSCIQIAAGSPLIHPNCSSSHTMRCLYHCLLHWWCVCKVHHTFSNMQKGIPWKWLQIVNYCVVFNFNSTSARVPRSAVMKYGSITEMMFTNANRQKLGAPLLTQIQHSEVCWWGRSQAGTGSSSVSSLKLGWIVHTRTSIGCSSRALQSPSHCLRKWNVLRSPENWHLGQTTKSNGSDLSGG